MVPFSQTLALCHSSRGYRSFFFNCFGGVGGLLVLGTFFALVSSCALPLWFKAIFVIFHSPDLFLLVPSLSLKYLPEIND